MCSVFLSGVALSATPLVMRNGHPAPCSSVFTQPEVNLARRLDHPWIVDLVTFPLHSDPCVGLGFCFLDACPFSVPTVTRKSGCSSVMAFWPVLANLKSSCGAGGTINDGTIEIQGDHRERAMSILRDLGWPAKLSGGSATAPHGPIRVRPEPSIRRKRPRCIDDQVLMVSISKV